MNVYAYVSGNTANLTDPMGLASEELIRFAEQQMKDDVAALGSGFEGKWHEVQEQLQRRFGLAGATGDDAEAKRAELRLVAHLYLKAHYKAKFEGGTLADRKRQRLPRPLYGRPGDTGTDRQVDIRHGRACFAWASAIFEGMESELAGWAAAYRQKQSKALDTEFSHFGWLRIGQRDEDHPNQVGHNYVGVFQMDDCSMLEPYDWEKEKEAQRLDAERKELDERKVTSASKRRTSKNELERIRKRIARREAEENPNDKTKRLLAEEKARVAELELILGTGQVEHPPLPAKSPDKTTAAILDSWSAVRAQDFADDFKVDTASPEYRWDAIHLGQASGTESWFLWSDNGTWKRPKRFPTPR